MKITFLGRMNSELLSSLYPKLQFFIKVKITLQHDITLKNIFNEINNTIKCWQTFEENHNLVGLRFSTIFKLC